jgi:hypothetical protein
LAPIHQDYGLNQIKEGSDHLIMRAVKISAAR